MPDQRFRGDPYQVLDVAHHASDTQIKRRWRELAREHHPDRAAGDTDEQARLTTRMARINAAYDLLRDPVRRADYDGSAQGRRARQSAAAGAAGARFDDEGAEYTPAGPPPPPASTPVTARFDTSASLRPRNMRTGEPAYPRMSGHRPIDRRAFETERDLRASTPTGPVERREGKRAEPLPTLQEARDTTLNFGRFHGYTLGEVELVEPAYIDWVARTITRDRELVVKARIIQGDLDRRGVNRRSRAAAPGFDSSAAAG